MVERLGEQLGLDGPDSFAALTRESEPVITTLEDCFSGKYSTAQLAEHLECFPAECKTRTHPVCRHRR
jgi:hypothetical protein